MNPYIFRPLLLIVALIIALNLLRPVALWQPLALLPMLVGVIFLHRRRSPWQGMALLVLIWAAFPLLKGIARHWLPWRADGLLAGIDAALWGGKMLPAYIRYEDYPLLTDILAFCYFLFFFIVLAAAYFFSRRPALRDGFFDGLLGVYLCGLCGYFLLPAAGPAFTTLPDTGAGGLIAPQLIEIVKGGVTGMDVFPSLHTALPLFINLFLWRSAYRRTALLMAPITLGIIIATVFLRYHYGIDVLAGIALALLWMRIARQPLPSHKDLP